MIETNSASTAAVAAYYDDGSDTCLRDYVQDNWRIRAATEFFVSWLTNLGSRRVLDVGCGIGNAAYEICERCSQTEVSAVDISPKRIELATQLFPHPRLRFAASDMETAPFDTQFDAILMMDVYEHIPRDRVDRFHQVLRQMLAPEGVILLTTPSPLHQAYLKANHPEGLQIVDETLGVSEIDDLARAVGGTVTNFNYHTVWRTNDYVHSVIERRPRYERRVDRRSLVRKALDKLPRWYSAWIAGAARGRRAQLVWRRLGRRVT